LWKLLEQGMASRPEARPRPAAQFARALDGVAGLTQAQGRALLGSAMRRLFPDEMGAQASDKAELRRLTRSAEELPTAQGHVLNQSGAEGSRRLPNWIGWGAGIAVIGAAAAMFSLGPRPTPPSAEPVAAQTVATVAPTPPPASSVEVGVQVNPAGIDGIEISIGGERVPAASPHRQMALAGEPIAVSVSAPGYRSAELQVVPDRNRSLLVTLAPLPSAVPRPSARTSAPRPAPSGLIRRYPF